MTAFSRPALSRFLILYAALYAGFGVQSPYLPSLLESRDLRPEAIALVRSRRPQSELQSTPPGPPVVLPWRSIKSAFDGRRFSAETNQSLSAIEPVSAPAKRKLKNREQRPAP